MINCFTYTYKTLARKGYTMPNEFEGYTMREPRRIISDYETLLEEEAHKRYFDSFCTEVEKAKENDVVIHNDGVGIAVNEMMYVTILYKPLRRVLQVIKPDMTIYRLGDS